MARLLPRFSNLLPRIRVNHRLAFYKRADKPFIEAPNPFENKQGWLKNQNNLLEPIWQVRSSFLVDIINSVELDSEQEMFTKLDDFDDCFGEEDADFSTN